MKLSFLALFIFSFAFLANARETIQQKSENSALELVHDQTVASNDNNQVAGQITYEQFCITCHQEGLLGAPKFKNETDWKARLTDRDMNDLLNSAINGTTNGMPAKGTCSECNEEDLMAAIKYMLPEKS